MQAQKHSLAFAVGLLAMSALGACPAGVARIDLHDGDSRVLRLVREEADELVERPTRQPVPSVPTPSRYPVAYSLEVFKSDAASGVFGGLDDRLADAVVLVATEPGFLPGQPSEFLLGSLGSFPLEPFSLQVVLAANLLDRLAAMPLGFVAGGRDLGNARYVVTRFGESRERSIQFDRLISGRLQFQDDRPCGFNKSNYITWQRHMSRDGLKPYGETRLTSGVETPRLPAGSIW